MTVSLLDNGSIPSLKRLAIRAVAKNQSCDTLPLVYRAVREDNADIFKEEKSATIIQARFRGKQVRFQRRSL